MKQTLVLGVGNPVMTDDAVGLHVVRRAAGLLGERTDVRFRESHRGGLDLVDILDGHHRAVVVDAFSVANLEPGTLVLGELEDVGSTNHLYGAHGVSLPVAVRMGRMLGADMPGEVRLLGVVVVDAYTLGEEMSPEIGAVVDRAARVVVDLVEGREVGEGRVRRLAPR